MMLLVALDSGGIIHCLRMNNPPNIEVLGSARCFAVIFPDASYPIASNPWSWPHSQISTTLANAGHGIQVYYAPLSIDYRNGKYEQS